jgi:IMP cyclohydrolase
MQKVTWLGLASAVVAVGLATTPMAAHADGYDTPRSATAVGAGNTYAAGLAAAEQQARQAVLAVGHDCTPGTYSAMTVYISPGGGTWVFRATHSAMCVD